MIRLLYFSESDSDPPYLRNLKENARFQTVLKQDFQEIQSILPAGWFDVCLLWVPEMKDSVLSRIQQIRDLSPGGALLLLTPSTDKEWEWSALRSGVDLILDREVESETLRGILERMGGRGNRGSAMNGRAGRSMPVQPSFSPFSNQNALTLFRDVSRVLSEPGDYRRMSDQFLLKLHDLAGIHRIALFTELPGHLGIATGGRTPGRMPCISAHGISAELKECLELSRISGLGRRMRMQSAAVTAETLAGDEEAAEIRKEIEIPGGVVALPVNSREGNIGVAILGDRLTGPLGEDDLQLITLLLEELGVALRNRWLQMERSEEKRLLETIFGALHCGCLVLDAEGAVIQSNRAFRKAMEHRGFSDDSATMEQLPGEIRRRVEAVRNSNVEEPPFVLVDEQEPTRVYQVTLVPLGLPLAPPQPLMVVLEDITRQEELKREEIQSSQSELIARIAKRFAHEIRNSLVPLTTHLQLFDERRGDADFHDSLKQALGNETERIRRFTDQMLFFSSRRHRETGRIDFLQILREGVETVFGKADVVPITIDYPEPVEKVWMEGEAESLGHAVDEVLLNARQAGVPDGRWEIRIARKEDSALEVQFLGSGALPDVEAPDAFFEPFFTTKNTGIGLGLPVARKIVEEHAGRLDLRAASPPFGTVVTMVLPYQQIECRKPSPSPSSV